jgi:hypothetical protein
MLFDSTSKGFKLIDQSQTAAGIAATSTPGLLYLAWHYFTSIPIEKWVSIATFIFVTLQIIFLLADRIKKRKAHRKARA